jgi:hypothetical protein
MHRFIYSMRRLRSFPNRSERWNNSRNCRQILMKFGIPTIYYLLSSHFNFHFNPVSLTTTLREDLSLLLSLWIIAQLARCRICWREICFPLKLFRNVWHALCPIKTLVNLRIFEVTKQMGSYEYIFELPYSTINHCIRDIIGNKKMRKISLLSSHCVNSNSLFSYRSSPSQYTVI